MRESSLEIERLRFDEHTCRLSCRAMRIQAYQESGVF